MACRSFVSQVTQQEQVTHGQHIRPVGLVISLGPPGRLSALQGLGRKWVAMENDLDRGNQEQDSPGFRCLWGTHGESQLGGTVSKPAPSGLS